MGSFCDFNRILQGKQKVMMLLHSSGAQGTRCLEFSSSGNEATLATCIAGPALRLHLGRAPPAMSHAEHAPAAMHGPMNPV